MARLTLPPVDCRYGAPLGRRQTYADDRSQVMRFRLQRVDLDRGGYDSGGAYWGRGAPLYWAEADLGETAAHHAHGHNGRSPIVTRYLRAADREDAKRRIRAEFPNARFYR